MMSLALLVCMAALAVMMQSASSQGQGVPDIPSLTVGSNSLATTLKCTNTKTNKTTCSSTCNKRCPHKCLIQCPSCKTFCCQYPIVAAIHFISLLHA
jgi:hypothetical protein